MYTRKNQKTKTMVIKDNPGASDHLATPTYNTTNSNAQKTCPRKPSHVLQRQQQHPLAIFLPSKTLPRVQGGKTEV